MVTYIPAGTVPQLQIYVLAGQLQRIQIHLVARNNSTDMHAGRVSL